MKTENPIRRFEDQAEHVTMTGWGCKTCRRFYGNDSEAERLARWCCANDLPCQDCDGRTDRPYYRCKKCQRVQQEKSYRRLPEAEWNGTDGLAIDGTDTFFFNVQSLSEYLEFDYDTEQPRLLEDVRLVICEKSHPREINLDEHFSDEVAECHEGWSVEIDDIVNDWLSRHFPESWFPGKTRPSLASLRAALNLQEAAPTSSEAA